MWRKKRVKMLLFFVDPGVMVWGKWGVLLGSSIWSQVGTPTLLFHTHTPTESERGIAFITLLG